MDTRKALICHRNIDTEQVAKIAEICLRYSSMEEQNKMLQREKLDLSGQVGALESLREHLNSELRHKDQQLRDKEEEVQALENSLQTQRADAGRKLQEKCNQITKLQQVWRKCFDRAKELVANCEANSNRLNFQVKELTCAFPLLEAECARLRRELQEKSERITSVMTNLDSSKADKENVLVAKLQAAAEERAELTTQNEHKLGLLRSEVGTLQESLRTAEARVAEKDREREALVKRCQDMEEAWIAKEEKWMEDKYKTNLDIQLLLDKILKLDRLAAMTDKEKAKAKKAEKKAKKEERKRREKHKRNDKKE